MFSFNVHFHVDVLRKCPVTVLADKSVQLFLSPSANLHVIVQMLPSFETLWTLLTCERLLSGMSSNVFLQTLSCCAGVVALFAIKGFFSIVNQHVSFEIGSSDG